MWKRFEEILQRGSLDVVRQDGSQREHVFRGELTERPVCQAGILQPLPEARPVDESMAAPR